MKIFINGQPTEVESGLTIASLLEARGYKLPNIAVEINQALCPRSSYASTQITKGLSIEIVAFVGGG